MDFDIASQASAIDDSIFPCIPQPPSIKSHNGYPGNHAVISGPRSGHWTVSSGGNGSGIDDRTPTFHEFAPSRAGTSEAGSVARVRRVDGDALRKLAAATEAQKRVKLEAQRQEAQEAVEEDLRQARSKSEKPKGFYLPQLQGMNVFDSAYSTMRTR